VAVCFIGESIMWIVSIVAVGESWGGLNIVDTVYTSLFYCFDLICLLTILIIFQRLAQTEVNKRLQKYSVTEGGSGGLVSDNSSRHRDASSRHRDASSRHRGPSSPGGGIEMVSRKETQTLNLGPNSPSRVEGSPVEVSHGFSLPHQSPSELGTSLGSSEIVIRKEEDDDYLDVQ